MTRSRFLGKLLTVKKAVCPATKVPKQTYFGPSSKTCPECLMTYTMSEADIKLHTKHHYDFIHGIVFPLKGNFYKVLDQDSKSLVILISEDSETVNVKLQKILQIVDDSLGSSLDSSTDFKKFLFLSGSRVLGVLLTESISIGHRVVQTKGNMICGSVYYNPDLISCTLGVYKIWVSKLSRRQGVATKLLDACLKEFNLSKDEIAFSQPSLDGAKLAKSYTKRDDFLIY